MNFWEGVTPPTWLAKLLDPAELLFIGLFFLWMAKASRHHQTDANLLGALHIGTIAMFVLAVILTPWRQLCYNKNMADQNYPNRLIAPVAKKLRLGEAKNDSAYWRTRSYQERIEALEQIREEYHHWRADAQSGFQRVYSIAKR